MESAHLTKAHEHVRNAATATFGNSIATAGHEHDQAASAFHEATRDTHNAEALRILALLEDHHRKLAGLIKEAPRKKEKKADSTTANDAPESSTASSSPASKGSAARAASPPTTTSPTRAPSSRRRLPQSSIASNLAEKRGIPGARRSAPSGGPVSVTNALAARNEQPATPVRDLLERQSRRAESSRTKDQNPPRLDRQDQDISARREASPTDDSFRRFYSAFGGVISAISAPLAFTSLPLNPAPPTPVQETQPPEPKEEKIKRTRTQSPEASRTVKSSEPDLAALISKPALRALREDGSAPLGPFANNESFYLVPTSGGTVSYANILQNPNAPHPHHAAQNPQLDSIDEGENEGSGNLKGSSHEEFVDARESVAPPSPTTRRPRSQGKSTSPSGGVTSARTIAAGRGTGLKTMEEIALENETLKNLVDKQAKRIQMWETSSQSSYNALAQSMRARSGVRSSTSDPSALVQALAMGPGAGGGTPLPSPPPTSHQHSSASNSPPPQNPSSAADANATKRIAELEALLSTQATRIADLASNNDQLAKQNERNSQVIGRYREQWEKLKAGARKKEQERREKRLADIKAGGATAAKAAESGSGNGTGDGDTDAGTGIGVGESDIGIAEGEEGFGKA